MRLLVGIPTYDRRIDIGIVRGLLNMERDGIDFDILMPVSSHISRNRNLCVQEALNGQYDYLLFWDSDIEIEKGFWNLMLETAYRYDAHIVVGCYKMKKTPDVYVLGHQEGDKYVNLYSVQKTPFPVDAGGTGIMLIHRSVLEKVEDPWFTILDGKNLFVMPEDFEFCRRAKEKGFTIMADPRFSTHHYGATAFSHQM